MNPQEPPQNGHRRPYQRSGFYAAKRAVVKYGTRVLPAPDTPVGRDLRAWRLALIDDLGGADQLSMQRLALVDQVIVQRYLVSSLDGYVLSLPALVNKRSRCLFPIVRERAAQVALLQSLLRDLGLERRARDVPDLASYLAQRKPSAVSSAEGVNRPRTSAVDEGADQSGAGDGEQDTQGEDGHGDQADAQRNVLEAHRTASITRVES